MPEPAALSSKPWRRYAEFYQAAYGRHVTGQRSAGRSGGTLIRVHQPAGAFPDEPTSDLTLAICSGPSYRGEAEAGAGRFRGALETGHAFLTPPCVPADFAADDSHSLLILSLPYARMAELLPDAALPPDGDFGPLHAAPFHDPTVPLLVERLWDEAVDDNPHGGLFADGAVLAITAALARRAGLDSRSARGGLAPARMRRVLALIEDRLEADLSLADLAEAAGVSLWHFERAFRQATGRAPHVYVQARRVERAKALLRDRNLGVAEIALACGFANQQHFTRVFARAVGCPPARWRREQA